MESSEQDKYGWHDGLRPRTRAESAADTITAVHEAFHEQIFQIMPDGRAHRCLKLILKKGTSLSDFQREILDQSYHRIVKEQTRDAHEAGATYLGIKQIPRELWNSTSKSLPRDYKRVYRLLYDVIDTNCDNADLQLIIGYSIVTIAFSSQFITRLPTLDLNFPIVLAQDEQPNWRLRQLVDVIGPSAFNDLLSKMTERHRINCQEIGCAFWDITSEQDWLRNAFTSKSMYIQFSSPLGQAARTWLLQKTKLPVISSEEIRQLGHALVAFASAFGVPEGWIEYREGSSESSWSDIFYDRAHSHAEALIENPSRRILPRMQDAAFYNQRFFSEVVWFTLLLAPPEQNSPLEWDVLLRIRTEGDGGGRAGHEAVMHWLNLCGRAASLGILCPRADMIVVTESLASNSMYYHAVSNLLQAIRLLRVFSGTIEILFWYVDSNYIEFLERSISTAQERKEETLVAFAAVHFYRGSEQPTAYSHGLGGITVAIARLPNTPGLFIRALTEYAGWTVRTAADSLLAKGVLTYISEDEVQKQMNVIRNALNAVDQYWANY